VEGFQEFTIVMPRFSPARLSSGKHLQHDRPIPFRHSRQHVRLPDAGHAVIRTKPDSGIGQKRMAGIPSTRPKVGNETDKDCLRARIDALYRWIEREQAAIDYLYILAVQDAYETCHDVEHIIGDEAYTDHDVEQYNNLLAVADQLYCVLPQGPHPSFDSGWRIKVRRNKGERKR